MLRADPSTALSTARRIAREVLPVSSAEAAQLLEGAAMVLLGEFALARERLLATRSLREGDISNRPALEGVIALGHCEFRLGDPRHALEIFRRAEQAALALKLPELQAEACLQRGIVHFATGNMGGSVEEVCNALDLFSMGGFRLGIVRARGNLANVFSRIGEHERAAEELLRVYAEFTELGNRRGAAHALQSLGTAMHNAQRLEEAVDFYRRALEAFEALGMALEVATASNNLGLALIALDRPNEAIGPLLRSLETSRRIGGRHQEVAAFIGLGRALSARFEFAEASQHFLSALELARVVGDRVHEVSALFYVASIRWRSGDRSELEQLPSLREALENAAAGALATAQVLMARDIRRMQADLAEAAGDFEAAYRLEREGRMIDKRMQEEAARLNKMRTEVNAMLQRLKLARNNSMKLSDEERLRLLLREADDSLEALRRVSKELSSETGARSRQFAEEIAQASERVERLFRNWRTPRQAE